MTTEKIIDKIEKEYAIPFREFISKYPERTFYSPDKNILFTILFKLIEDCEPENQSLDFFIDRDKSYNFKVENFTQVSEILKGLNVTTVDLDRVIDRIYTKDIYPHHLDKPFFLKSYFFKGIGLNEYF